MHILITGATGFIGQALVTELAAKGHTMALWVRNLPRARRIFRQAAATVTLEMVEQLDQLHTPVDAVVNLAGEAIIDRPWTDKRKRQLESSRIDLTRELVTWMAQQTHKAEVLVSGSAIGIYGHYPEDLDLGEQASFRDCYPSQLCQQWEFEAKKAHSFGVRVCLLRTGAVLHPAGGALKKLYLPFKLGLGGRVGSGQQWLSWIHRDDMVSLIVFLLQNNAIAGPINATAPTPVRYEQFTRALAERLKRPHLFPVPERVIKLLFGEAAQLLVEGQKVLPQALQQRGFTFRYATITDALNSFTM